MEQLPKHDSQEQMNGVKFAVVRSEYMSDGGVTIKNIQQIVAVFDNEQAAADHAGELGDKYGYENFMTGWSDGPPDSISFEVQIYADTDTE